MRDYKSHVAGDYLVPANFHFPIHQPKALLNSKP